MKKNSVKSLKEWVRKIKRYEYELPKLYEKLEYLKVKSIGYNSPSFEPRISSNGSYFKSSIDYWLERIEECEAEIKKKEYEVKSYYNFLFKLKKTEKIVFLDYFYYNFKTNYIIKKHNLKRDTFYKIIKSICKT